GVGLVRDEVAIGSRTRDRRITSWEEAAAIEHNNITTHILSAGLIGTADAHCQRLVEHGLCFVGNLTVKLGDGLSHYTKKKITFLHDEGLEVIFPTLHAGGR